MNADVAGAVAAELLLLTPELRADRAAVDALLAEDFTELGASGRTWSRAELLDALPTFRSTSDLTVSEVVGREVGADTVLVTYVTARNGEEVYRSSVWTVTSTGWKIVHHQATRLP